MSLAESDAPEELRQQSIEALTNQAEYIPLAYWSSIDLDRSPSLLPAVASALSVIDPGEMLRMLTRVASPPEDLASLEYPLRIALRDLVRTKRGWRLVLDALENGGNWTVDLLDTVMQFSEFNRYQQGWQTAVQAARRRRSADAPAVAQAEGAQASRHAKDIAELLGTIEMSASALYSADDPHVAKVANNIVARIQEAGSVLFQMQHGDRDAGYQEKVPQSEHGRSTKMAVAAPVGGQTILVVDDNRDFASIVVLHLEQAGYRVLFASNFDEADSVLTNARETIDLLVTDIELPDSLNRLRHHGGLLLAETSQKSVHKPRVVFITGGMLDDQIEKSAEKHGTLLVKPFGFPVLLQTIREMIKRPRTKQPG
jgi:CheY-like chemotaxis protein